MAIRTMTDKAEYEAGVPDIDIIENGVYGNTGPLYMKTTHRGLVLNTYERNGYDDSDFYATVWNVEKGKPQDICYASTRGWTYANGAVIDATPEVRALYDAYVEKQNQVYREHKAAIEAATPKKGKVVKVVRGRKVPIGTQGTCIWVGPDKFARVRNAFRVGIATPTGTVFTAIGNVEVVQA